MHVCSRFTSQHVGHMDDPAKIERIPAISPFSSFGHLSIEKSTIKCYAQRRGKIDQGRAHNSDLASMATVSFFQHTVPPVQCCTTNKTGENLLHSPTSGLTIYTYTHYNNNYHHLYIPFVHTHIQLSQQQHVIPSNQLSQIPAVCRSSRLPRWTSIVPETSISRH